MNETHSMQGEAAFGNPRPGTIIRAMTDSRFDVVVIGAGNAAMCAALCAAEHGARTAVLEAAPKAEAGGNSWFTDGAFRVSFDDSSELGAVVAKSELARADIPAYPAEAFRQDLSRAGARDDLAALLAESSQATLRWMHQHGGVAFELIGDNQSWEADGRRKFFGGLCVRSVDKGVGLIRSLHEKARNAGIEIFYQTPAQALMVEDGVVCAVHCASGQHIACNAVVLACGGFEADAEWRAEHLGAQWRHARVRGTRHNTGAGLRMAQALGANLAGEWGGCHAVGADANAPDFGDFSKPGDIWKKHSYPYGLIVNKNGERFVDEGADIRNYTYAQYGREILNQPGGVAWQIFDSQTEPLLRSEYRRPETAKFEADSIEALAAQLDLDRERFLQTVAAYNAAVQDGEFAPHRKDGKATLGLDPPKSNWALRLDSPPFLAFPIICGITFTFGGLHVDTRTRVLRGESPIPGLFAAGEMVGDLFRTSYPGGAGLMSGAVFGRIAGAQAAAACAN